MYNFTMKNPMQRFADYREYDLDGNQTAYTVLDSRLFNWPERTGGLILGVESMGMQTYQAIPVKRDSVTQQENARINRLYLRIGDLDYQNSQLFLGNLKLVEGATVVIRRIYKDLDLADSLNYRVFFRGKVTAVSGDKGNLGLEVSERYFDWKRPLNKRVYSKVCNWVFKSGRCGYLGAETFCDKTYTQCQAYGQTASFGGFPEVPGLQFYGFR
ncbi:MAG: hypothetical protein ACE5GM_03165 [bacterium]